MNPQRSESSSLKKNQLGKKLENYQIQKLVSKNQNENINPQVNNIFSASKSQANITINNFAKLDYIVKGGNPSDVGAKIMADGTVWAANSNGTYTQIK